MQRNYIYVNINKSDDGNCYLVVRPEFSDSQNVHLQKAYKKAMGNLDAFLKRHNYKPVMKGNLIQLNKEIKSLRRLFNSVKSIINTEFKLLGAYVVTPNDDIR